MMNATVQVARRHWWLLLLRGILAILFGIIALAAPGIALLAFIYVIFPQFDGVVECGKAVLKKGEDHAETTTDLYCRV